MGRLGWHSALLIPAPAPAAVAVAVAVAAAAIVAVHQGAVSIRPRVAMVVIRRHHSGSSAIAITHVGGVAAGDTARDTTQDTRNAAWLGGESVATR